MSFRKTGLVSLFLLLLLTPLYAYHTELYQWADLNKTTPYLNEFMVCYFRNSTTLIWDTYNGGVSQFFTPNASLIYDLYCCDNCRIDNNISIHLSPNSLHYQVDSLITIDENTILEYAINDIIEDYRTLAVATSSTGTILNRFSDYQFGGLIPIEGTMIAIFVLTIPLTAWIFTTNIMITLMAFGISLIVGIFVAYSWGLMGFITFILVDLMLIAIMWFMSKMMGRGN